MRTDDGEIVFSADEAVVPELSVALVEAGVGIGALVPHRPSLEDLFFQFTEGEDARADGSRDATVVGAS